MNTEFLGDSYDLVKRVFLRELSELGYHVTVDPMYTDEWTEEEKMLYHTLIGSGLHPPQHVGGRALACFLDPDTGIRLKRSKAHVSFEQIDDMSKQYTLVLCYDQSFSNADDPHRVMKSKLTQLATLGCSGLYYNSHARFLFVSRDQRCLEGLAQHLMSIGFPSSRLVRSGT